MPVFADISITNEYDELWHSCLEYIRYHCQNDPLYQNYLWYNSQYMMRYQLDAVKRLNLPASFISREGNYKKSFQKYINLVNTYNNTNFILLDGLYAVCGPMIEIPDSCKQMIAVNISNSTDPDYFICNSTILKKVNDE